MRRASIFVGVVAEANHGKSELLAAAPGQLQLLRMTVHFLIKV